MSAYDEEKIAELLRLLPPAPAGWVQAAKELPLARRELGQIVARAEADAAFRQQLIADLESALEGAGYEPRAELLDDVRAHLHDVRPPSDES